MNALLADARDDCTWPDCADGVLDAPLCDSCEWARNPTTLHSRTALARESERRQHPKKEAPVTQYTATVTALTAEVRVLMVGSRQVTLSVYRQLDRVHYEQIEPLGRVRDSRDDAGTFVVGRRVDSGDLVRSGFYAPTVAEVESKCARVARDLETAVAKEQQQLEHAETRIERFRKIRAGWHSGDSYPDSAEQQVTLNYLKYWETEAADLRSKLEEKRNGHKRVAAVGLEEVAQARQDSERTEAWEALPLIVLAGLT